ncbi:Ectonucleoside triphosphate diphosphohydrolase 3 [Camelus dromedarius]|uniref:Ectonucleoside triphosphate diphosphohydrolase 3 n=1 Tax=Camelus dromedarius TaxID=9838 RepID=A0A5N4CYR3_CAMDR|nr:Ectonucleoside triphosphate diphosphohydrolase 3 [Camelus dromedarius]
MVNLAVGRTLLHAGRLAGTAAAPVAFIRSSAHRPVPSSQFPLICLLGLPVLGLKGFSRTPAIITFVVLLLSTVVLVTITVIQIHQKEVLLPGLKYGIVLDAGSSRTTVYVYQWPAEKENNTGVVSETFKCSVKGSGISSYWKKPQDAPKAFEDCMQKVKRQRNLWHMWVHPNGAETVGALDLGGASTQISFVAEEKVGQNNSSTTVSLYGYEYMLYTHSFQCYGRNEAERRFLALLLQLPLLLPRFDEGYARSYCFSAHYIYHLLVHGYKFTEETWPKIHFEKEVGNSSIGWSLGYMLSLTNQIPAESRLIRLPIQPSSFTGIVAFFAAVALLCLTYLVYLCVSSRNQRRSQNSLDHVVDSE